MPRFAAIVAALAVLLGGVATNARADGDPASDVLIGGPVFVGFGTSTTTPEIRELLQLTAEARRKGFPIRVAVIRDATDLGAVPVLFGHAQRYATFLGQELRFGYRGTLVVAMGGKPGGVGVFGPGATPRARAAVRGLAVPTAGDANELARVASTAVRRVAAANGHTLTTPHATATAGSHVVVFAVAAVVLAVGVLLAGLVVFRRRG